MTPSASMSPPSLAHDAAEFRLPSARDLCFICASALMPYVLACVLLAV